ncbi:MAG: 50S ribosomal protein L25 [Acholeplasmataceae bacterium]|nr:MAG: 50S ribosomal protein L25 [Acholeplasmataceae bacterium]
MKLELRTQPLNRVRGQGLIPGVMYGRSIESTSVQVEDKAFKDALKAYGKNMTFKVKLDGKTHTVYIKNVQSNILKPSEIIHFDLHRISATETITAEIPLVITGKEKFYQTRAFPQQALSALTCEVSAGSGMQQLEVDVSGLEVGDAIYVKDLTMDAGIKIKDDPEHMIVVIKEASEVEEPVEEDEEVEGEEAEDTEDEAEIKEETTE